MLKSCQRRDATQNEGRKKPINIFWLLKQDIRIITAVVLCDNPTQTQTYGFQLGLSARQVRNARRLAKLKRDDGEFYDKLMQEYQAHLQSKKKKNLGKK